MSDPSQPLRLVVFTGDPGHWVRKGIVAIDEAIPGIEWLVVVHRPSRSVASLLRSQWRNLRRNGWRWIPYQLADIWRRVARRGAAPSVPPDAPGRRYTAVQFAARPNLRVLEVGDLHAPATLEQVRAFAPRLGLSLAAPLLRRELFAIPAAGTLNLHKGRLPDYRGMPPAFWEFWNDETEVGCTVHWVDDGLDTGAVVARATVAREPHSTPGGVRLRLHQVGVETLCGAVRDVLAGTHREVPQGQGGRTYRKPTLAQVARLARKLRPTRKRGPRQFAKDAVARTAFVLWRYVLGRFMAPRVTVLLYHRVSDAVRDNLTVGVEQFDRQMALLRRHCQVVSLEEILEWKQVPRSARPIVCVTFDDGYLDNYEHAAPILASHQVPAAFFVSTGIVASDRRFPHDVRRNNPPIPVMQWDQMRRMRADGFTIGSHSVSHIDCAKAPEDEVRAELLQSKEDLRRELHLAADEIIFAYPYGGRQHMTPQRLELVRQAGYRACLSAYGGSNVGTVDPFNVLRRGINWEFSDAALLFECLGLR